MEKDLWLDPIKRRLKEHSEPLPPAGWERLEQALEAASGSSLPASRRSVLFRYWRIGAAAALLVAVSVLSLWLLQSPLGDEVKQAGLPPLAVLPDRLPDPLPTDTRPEDVKEARLARREATPPSVGRTLPGTVHPEPVTVEGDSGILSEALPPAEDSADAASSATIVQDQDEEEQSTTQQPARRPAAAAREKLRLPDDYKPRSAARNWSVGLSVGNTGTAGNTTINGLGYGSNPVFSAPYSYGKFDLTATSNGVVSIPDNQELIFRDGVPYVQTREAAILSAHHKQPVSFGLSVRKELPHGFSVETGLTYTYLASDIECEGVRDPLKQKLHYVGIPLRANWSFLSGHSFALYLAAGAAVEKCVYGRLGDQSETVKPLQFSLMGAVGGQYNLSRRVGLYVEPGISYFFDDGSQVQTIRKENPCNFTLQAGIRLSY